MWLIMMMHTGTTKHKKLEGRKMSFSFQVLQNSLHIISSGFENNWNEKKKYITHFLRVRNSLLIWSCFYILDPLNFYYNNGTKKFFCTLTFNIHTWCVPLIWASKAIFSVFLSFHFRKKNKNLKFYAHSIKLKFFFQPSN